MPASKARRPSTRKASPGASTKGERTAARILDAAERVFAARGYQAATLREIARAAEIQQPGLYNHFASKQQLYESVLERAFSPMLDAMSAATQPASSGKRAEALVATMTDHLHEHPQIAPLFQQALHGGSASPGHRMVRRWLDRLFAQGLQTAEAAGAKAERIDLALQVIALFNTTTGYFLAGRALASMVPGARLDDPETLERQKQLLARVARATLPR